MVPFLAVAIPLCCAALRPAVKEPWAQRQGGQVVADAFAASAAPPQRVGAARHFGQALGATARLEARGTESAKPAASQIAASQHASPPSGRVGEDTDAEVLRIEKNLDRINHDRAARHAFYEQIDKMVSLVRKGKIIPEKLMLTGAAPGPALSSNERVSSFASTAPPMRAGVFQYAGLKPSATAPREPPPALILFHSTALPSWAASTAAIRSAAGPVRDAIPRFPAKIRVIQSPSGNGALDARVVSRLLYWAKQNKCPAELALATAWQESRMTLHPADGSSGEIGILQILPARAKAEGVNPKSLRNPDVDMWLGTKLLAEYFQQDGSIRRAAMQYVAGPNVFAYHYPARVRDYVAWYSNSVHDYAGYFKHYVDF
ncbi:MAG TPA: transglycosylase SLT domain-containing protein [Terriglobia bacterium]|nr:transglycosylase SLT domain-containing protein [Terriglobia bacterium]